MTAEAAAEIAKLVAAVSPYPWPADGTKHEAWVRVLASPATADIRDDVAVATVTRMVTEYDPDKLTPAQIVTTCRSRPVIPRRLAALPPPEDASGPALKPIYWPGRNGREQFPLAEPDEGERMRLRATYARMEAEARAREEPRRSKARDALEGVLMRLGSRMRHLCARCGAPMVEDEVRSYVQACMDAGARQEREPPVKRCYGCSDGVLDVDFASDAEAPPF